MYRETAAPPALRPYVECLWTRDPAGAPAAEHRVLPDGCIDLIFAFAGDGALADAYAVGTMTRAIMVGPHDGAAMLGVRFHPGGASALLGCEASPLTDLRVPLRDAAPSLPPDVEARLHAAGEAARAVELCRALEGILPAARAVDPLVAAACARVRGAEGRLRVERLGDALGVTRQHLARAFARHVGVSPKTFARVARLQALVRRARSESDPRWSVLAAEMGFADQAHLCGEFRELVGVSPARFAASG
ncbi:MAG: DUF6597 domain-containing transcriptional factor [Gemmatimonadaceae bacterium]